MKRLAVSACAAAALIAGLTPAPALAADKEKGFYVGGSAGISDGDITNDSINQALSKNGLTNAGIQSKGKDSFAFKVFLGYSLFKYLALEGGYFNLGSFSYNAAAASPLSSSLGSVTGEANIWGGNFDILGILPLGNWRLFARGGVVYTHSTTELTSTGVPLTQNDFSESKVGWKAGAGFGYEFASNVGLRGEWEHYWVDDGTGATMNVDTLMASMLYRF